MPTKYKTAEFLTEKGQPLTINRRDVQSIDGPDVELRWQHNAHFIHGEGVYEIVKMWTDDRESHMRVWVKQVDTIKPTESKHEDSRW